MSPIFYVKRAQPNGWAFFGSGDCVNVLRAPSNRVAPGIYKAFDFPGKIDMIKNNMEEHFT